MNKIPQCLRDQAQWCVWKIINRDGDKTKVPFQVTDKPASSTNAETWTDFSRANTAKHLFAGLGFVFSADDPFCGVDFDGCRDPETREVAPWAKDWITRLNSYSEVSPSGTGVKVFVRAKSPADKGRKVTVNEPAIGDKTPAVELYDWGRYFAVTGLRLGGVSADVEDRQTEINELYAAFFDVPAATGPVIPVRHVAQDWRGDAAVMERARKYLARLPVAVSQQGGHNATFHAACCMVLGFNLDELAAFALLQEWNQSCQPPWSERDLQRKVAEANRQPGERGYLRDAKPANWDRIDVPQYKAQEPKAEVRITTLQEAAEKYLDKITTTDESYIELGIPLVDYAIGGGVEQGELVVMAARPSHGKSAIALQCVHHVTLAGMPALFVSEEMSALALGKRTLQWATDTPQEHWRTSSIEIGRHVTEHFADRAPCYVIESCGTTDKAVDAIFETIEKHKVKFVVVDYAQLLAGKGKGRYEQTTNTSIALRKLATETGVVLVALCQLNREVEKRNKFIPVMSDVKDTGQFEQDADVILFLAWPHRLDSKNDPKKYMVFVAKNRNRPINTPMVEFTFMPSRQMFVDGRAMPFSDDDEHGWDNPKNDWARR